MLAATGQHYKLLALRPHHFQVIDRILAGQPLSFIRRALGYSSHLYDDIASPLFQHELAIRRSALESQQKDQILMSNTDVKSVLSSQVAKAVEALGLLVDSQDESIKLRAAQDILDRSGYPKLSASKTSNDHSITISPETAALLAETLSLLSPQSFQSNGRAPDLCVSGGFALGKTPEPAPITPSQPVSLPENPPTAAQ